MRRTFDLSVYLITDRPLSAPRRVIDVVEASLAGGATMIQLRDPVTKTRGLVDEARAIAALTRPRGIPFIVNDRVDVALAAGADGVHVGQSDMAPADVRRLIGPDPILGLSITELDDLDRSDFAGVDYLGVGPVFATMTKADAAPAMGVAGLQAVAARARLPIVGIGGIGPANAASVVAAGADGIAIVSAISAAADPAAATRDLVQIVRQAREDRRR
jgi:thiamine-phosphate pyrophosphorylase